MTWTLEEIEQDWFGGQRINLPRDEVEQAFAMAEQARGHEWVLGPELPDMPAGFPGLGRRGGFASFLRVYALGRRLHTVAGARGFDALLRRIIEEDQAAESELSAMYLLRARNPHTKLEVGPEMRIGKRNRQPDFRIRNGTERWVYVEVTRLLRSGASARVQALLQRIAVQVMSIRRAFLLEIVLWREPTEDEEEELAAQAMGASEASDGHRRDIGTVASLLARSGDPAVVIPSILPPDDGTRMSLAQSVIGPGEPNRQIVVRVPFSDQRAEDVLTAEARQLPRDECGLVIVDVSAQPTAFESWEKLVPPRFSSLQHTRVGGVLLFMFGIHLTDTGLAWLPHVKLIENPHARVPLPSWITETVSETRTESRRRVGRPD